MRFPEFKDEWATTTLGSLVDFKNGINADSSKYGSGIKYISVSDILDQRPILYESIRSSMTASEDQLREFSVTYGDILFQRSSETVEDIGQANVYLDNKPCLFGGFVIRGKKKADYDPLFMKYALKAPVNRKKVIIKGAGAQHYNIGQENLFSIRLSICEKEEQAKISRLLSALDLRMDVQRKIIKERMTLEKALCSTLKTTSKEKLEELCTCVSSTLQESQTNEYGQYPVYGANGLVGYRDDFQFERPGVAIIKDGAGVGRVYSISDDKYSILGTMSLLLPQKDCSLSFLYFALKNLSFGKYIVGSGIPHIYFKNYQKAAVPSQNKKTTTIASMVEINKKYVSVSKMTLLSLENEKAFLLANLFC